MYGENINSKNKEEINKIFLEIQLDVEENWGVRMWPSQRCNGKLAAPQSRSGDVTSRKSTDFAAERPVEPAQLD